MDTVKIKATLDLLTPDELRQASYWLRVFERAGHMDAAEADE